MGSNTEREYPGKNNLGVSLIANFCGISHHRIDLNLEEIENKKHPPSMLRVSRLEVSLESQHAVAVEALKPRHRGDRWEVNGSGTQQTFGMSYPGVFIQKINFTLYGLNWRSFTLDLILFFGVFSPFNPLLLNSMMFRSTWAIWTKPWPAKLEGPNGPKGWEGMDVFIE